MLIYIALASIFAAIIAVLVLAARKPNMFRVERTISIDAATATIFALINDFHHWPRWSPWEKLDPAMQRKYTGATNGVGAVYEWQGKGKVGAGRMEILQSQPSTKIVIKLDFIKPFEGHNTAEFVLKPVNGVTLITWSMYGPATFITRVMGVLMNMDKLIGKDFETGLANIKATVESTAA